MRGNSCLQALLPTVCILAAAAQQVAIRTTVPLVVAPAIVTDHKGRFLDGLTPADFELYADGKLQRIQVDEAFQPVALVAVVQANEGVSSALAKIRKIGSMIEPLLTGRRGDAAVITCGDRVEIRQPFTSDPQALTNAFAGIRASGVHAHMIDGVVEAVHELAARSPNRRRVILLIGETRDRSSETKLEEAISRAQAANVMIYSVTFSAYATPFTTRPGDAPVSPDGGINIIAILTEIARMGKTNAAEAFARYTGGRHVSFLKQIGLEQAVSAIGEDLHSQYVLSFTPQAQPDALFHEISVRLPNHPEAIVRTRPGYWFAEK